MSFLEKVADALDAFADYHEAHPGGRDPGVVDADPVAPSALDKFAAFYLQTTGQALTGEALAALADNDAVRALGEKLAAPTPTGGRPVPLGEPVDTGYAGGDKGDGAPKSKAASAREANERFVQRIIELGNGG